VPLFFYTLLFYLLLPLVCLRLWWRGRRAPAYRQRWRERFGFGTPVLEQCLWVHAVSVGETLAAQPLVNALLERYPGVPVLVTTMTPTGSERVRALWGERVQHVYAPYDLPAALRRFLRRARPRILIIMETELWPNMLHAARKAGVPVLLANARLSERSARGYGRAGALTRQLLQDLSHVAAQDAATASRFQGLGLPAHKLTVTGSIKFDITVAHSLIEGAQELRRQWQLATRPVLVAASTHAGEDAVVLEAFRLLQEHWPEAFLILVPRHPERFDEVARLIAGTGLPAVRRSSGAPVDAATAILLGDSMGELLRWFAMADVAFMGGSLVPVGGHNMLEPLALGLPTLTGPHLFNFQSIADELFAASALTEVHDARELADAVAGFWSDPVRALARRQAGLAVLERNRGALQRQLGLVSALLGEGA
jgi:3-deoxy-D-manno-octulosonic-acid transferase